MAKWIRVGLWIAVLTTIVWTCGGTLFPDRAGRGIDRIVVYGFSILAEPMRDEIFPLFRAKWRRETGSDVEFVDSFAASGTVANQIVYGAPADVAILSHPGDADRIVEARRAGVDWRQRPFGGIVNRTAIAILVREGNPRGIASFADLGRPNLTLIHPDPLTSGGAQWAILAEYAEPLMSARARGLQPSPDVAEAQLASIWRNVVAQAPSARAARSQFDHGFGDAVVTYEVELFADAANGHSVDMVIPPTTILTEHPVVLVDRNVRPAERAAVEAFVDFLTSEDAQRAFVRYGFRSVRTELDAANPRLTPLPRAYEARDLGGWETAVRSIVDRVWRGSVLAGGKR